MTDTRAAHLCRLTVHAPGRVVDLAVPADVPVGDLLPTLVGYAGDDLEESGLEHGGWVLQRLGEPPLDPELTLDALALRDGETLHLLPRAEALPEVRLDDLVDGISSTLTRQPHGWSPDAGRRLLNGLATATLLLGLVLIALPGGPAGRRALAAAVAGLLIAAGAGVASRAVGDGAAAATLGLMAGPYLALAGWLVPGGELAGPDGHEVLGARLLAASAAAAGGSVLTLAAVGVRPALFLGSAIVALAGALGAVLMTTAALRPAQAAAVVAVVFVLFGGFVPSLSFRFSGMRMPPLPGNAQQLQEGIGPYPAADVRERAIVADGWMTALFAAVGTVGLVCLTALSLAGTLAATLTAAVLALLLLLHGRGLGNVWQRLALTGAGAAGAALLLLAAAVRISSTDRLVLLAGLLATAAVIAIASWTVPGRRLVPYWGRAAELLHSTAAIAVLPLALWTLGVYDFLRSLNG
ncbi:type VII secretion integral membrane protein EccD [Streptomyces sp. AM 2-1-1]|uniref:type VII secretion integral membrane protein EccD n=1 Tax=Streptomyces sp. AM 2-1-1 TaxID=3028709 RepID=UPI0023B9F4A5|nr:type VII secretion integral membrane protein EccD [Streptomyces sp. AM 2-1-1]WEH43411.1 type VII secretion integral membrane protein EccD [Streptomyces sp. AM 2-1-1]